jgi:glycosyltransferase involved in cell wall biosynthesis
MRIIVVVSTYPPYKGGMGNVAAAHAEALRQAGHEVMVLAPGVGLRPWLTFGNAAVAPQLLWKLRGFDAVELHYPFYGGAEWVWLWKKIFGRRTRLSIYYHMDNVGRGLLGAVFRLYRALLLAPILSCADIIMCSSRDYLASSQAAAFGSDPRVREVPLAVDIRRFHPDAAIGKEKAAIFVGGLDAAHYFKGLHVLMKAFEILMADVPDAELWIVGGGELSREDQRIVDGKALNRRVKVLGRVEDDDLPDLYRRASVHVLPSIDRSEAFGLVTLEAAASGIPSIVSDLPGVRSVIEPGVTGYAVPPGDAQGIAARLMQLFKDPARARRMGEAARVRMERLYATSRVDAEIVAAVTGR